MADLERIAPPVPTLPAPIGRNVGSRQRRPPEREPQPRAAPDAAAGSTAPPRNSVSDHIDEYA
jgi:hypothetical protein